MVFEPHSSLAALGMMGNPLSAQSPTQIPREARHHNPLSHPKEDPLAALLPASDGGHRQEMISLRPWTRFKNSSPNDPGEPYATFFQLGYAYGRTKTLGRGQR